ncbi:MAG: hypothetical protein AAF483_07755 [Planctomycetota bacterium]
MLRLSLKEFFFAAQVFPIAIITWLLMAPGIAANIFFLLLMECSVIIVVVRLLFFHLPQAIAEATKFNERRADGSLSLRRRKREGKALEKLHKDLFGLCALAFTLANICFFGLLLVKAWSANLQVAEASAREINFPWEVLFATLAGIVGISFLARSYQLSLQDFFSGVSQRRQEYETIDVSRLQDEYEHEQRLRVR